MKHLYQKGFSAIEVLLIIAFVGGVVGAGIYIYKQRDTKQLTQKVITSYDECIATGNPVMESYPEQCNANGQSFVNEQQAKDYQNNFETVPFSSINQELQEAIKKAYEKIKGCQTTDSSAPGYLDYDRIITKQNAREFNGRDAAVIPVGCIGGSLHLFVYENGTWRDVAVTQMGFGCDLIDKYKVSAKVVSFCVDKNGESRKVIYP